MRTLELGKIAAQAEKIRLQQLARRQTRRMIYLAVAAIFAMGAIGMVHVLLWNVLSLKLGSLWASAILLVMDIIVAGGCSLVGARSRPTQTETAAINIRQEALRQARETLLIALLPAATMLGRGTARGGLSLVRNFGRVFTRRRS